MEKEEFDKKNVFGLGEPNVNFSQFFIGNSYLNPLAKVEDAGLSLFNVTFEPGCRNNWHIHHSSKGGGQILVCIAGEGWYQEEGKEAQSLTPGTVVTIPANVKHWHGAKKDSWFSHIAVEVPGEDASNEWCEPVTDDIYNKMQYYNKDIEKDHEEEFLSKAQTSRIPDKAERLIEFRKKKSKEKNIPAYYIFTDKELEKILELHPKTIKELEESKILTDVKLKLYGKEIIDIINNNL